MYEYSLFICTFLGLSKVHKVTNCINVTLIYIWLEYFILHIAKLKLETNP